MYSFEETQKFRQWWLWMIIIASMIISVATPIIVLSSQGKLDRHGGIGILVVCITPALVTGMMLAAKLKTKIDGTGIYYRFMPFILKGKKIDWTDVSQAYVRKYSPLAEYGGWGVKYSFKHGKAINVSGDMGLQLVLKTGKKVLVGTKKPDELNLVIQDLVRSGMINVSGQMA